MTLEKLRERERVPARPFYSHRERLEAAAKQKSGERVEHASGVDQMEARLRYELAATCEHARCDVVVSVQVLRRRFADEVGAELERPAQRGRGERVVDDEEAVSLRRRDGGEVGEREARVRHRLDVPDPRRPLPAGQVGRVDIYDLDPQATDQRLDEAVGIAVEL